MICCRVGREGLDSTSRVRSSSTSTSATTSAGQARDDNTEEAGDGTDNSLEYTSNAINYSHDASTDGLEERLDLLLALAAVRG